MEKTIQKQINRIQALTANEKERFLRIYFYESNHSTDHSISDDVVLTVDTE